MSIFSESVADFFNAEMTTSALYIPVTGTQKTVNVIFDEDEADNNYTNVTVANSIIEIDVLVGEVSAAAQGDIFRIGSYDYQVMSTSVNQEGIITCGCTRGPVHILVPLEDNDVPITANGSLLMAKI